MPRVTGSVRIAIGLSLLVPAVVPVQGAGDSPAKTEIDRLDRAIQARFQDLDNRRFGITRLPTQHKALLTLDPQTEAEKSTVQSLIAHGWDAVLYAARPPLVRHQAPRGQAAGAETRSTLVEVEGQPYRYRPASETGIPPLQVMVGPLRLTRPTAATPTLRAGEENVRRLLADAMAGKESRLQSGRWQLVARPVRASQEACVTCHAKTFQQKSRVGDPLGVAVYAFTHTNPK